MQYLKYLLLGIILLLTTQCSDDSGVLISDELPDGTYFPLSVKQLKGNSKNEPNKKWEQDFSTIKDEILSINKNKKFLDRLIKNVGHPNWDHAFSASEAGEGFPYYVPFLLPELQHTNALLVVTEHKNGKKLDFKLVERDPLVELLYFGSAKKIDLRHLVFASIFQTLDIRIFEYVDPDLKLWTETNADILKSKNKSNLKSCDRYPVCFDVYNLSGQGCYSDPNSPITCTVTYECYWYEDCGGGDSGIGGPITGGGSYGGSSGGTNSGGSTCYTCEVDANYPQDSDPSAAYVNLNESEYYTLLIEGFLIAEIDLINRIRKVFDDAMAGLAEAWPKSQEEWDELIIILIDEFTDTDVLIEFVPFVGDFISAMRNFEEKRFWSIGLDIASAGVDVFGGRFGKASVAISQVTNRSFRILTRIVKLRRINVSFINKMPKHWRRKSTDGAGGVQYFNPNNSRGDHIRVMPANPNSPHASQRVPYVKRVKGSFVDKNGNKINPKTGKPWQGDEPEVHIPWTEYSDFNFN